MDGARFDELVRQIATRSSRRSVVRGVAGAAVVAVAGVAGLRGGGSRAEDGLATPELTVEPFDPTQAPPDPTLVPTEAELLDPTIQPTATSTATSTSTATPTSSPTPTPAGPRVQGTPVLVLTPSTGKVGTSVSAVVSGFTANEAIQLRWYTGASFVSAGGFTVNSRGTGSFTFTIPATTSGSHRVRAQGGSGRADAYFDVKRSTRLSPTSGPRGTTVTVTLRGFKANKQHQIRFFSFDTRTGTPLVLGTVTTSSTGSASTTITIPANALFTKHRIEALEVGGTAYAGAFFTVPQPAATPTPTATNTPLPRVFTLSPTTGPRGTVVTVQLRNFKPSTAHQIRFYGGDTAAGTPLVLASPTTNGSGAADTSITIPGNALFTKHLIEAKETAGSVVASAFFTVPAPPPTATPTPTPTPTSTPICVPLRGFCRTNQECCSGVCIATPDGPQCFPPIG